MNIEINTQAILEQIRDGKALTGNEGALAPQKTSTKIINFYL